MKLKGWGVPPFNPTGVGFQASSRKIRDDKNTDLPRYRLEADRGSLEFMWNLPTNDSFAWITFTNTGRLPLTNLTQESDLPFLVQGGIPKVLRTGESFKLRVKFDPEEPKKYESFLVLRNKDVRLKIELLGIWNYIGLMYDGTARHNGKFYYGGGQGLPEFFFDGSEFFDGKYVFAGVKYRGDILN